MAQNASSVMSTIHLGDLLLSSLSHVAVVGWPDRQTVERASELFTSNFNFNFFYFNLLPWSRKGMHKLAR